MQESTLPNTSIVITPPYGMAPTDTLPTWQCQLTSATAVVGSRAMKPSITHVFETALGSFYRNVSVPYESNTFRFTDNPSNINTLPSMLHATSPLTVPTSIFTVPHFWRYFHEVHAALSLFVSLPFFIGLETVVNGIKI
jgi:hypothetical protein